MHVYQMMEMKYLGVPNLEDPESLQSAESFSEESMPEYSLRKKLIRFFNDYLQISALAYQHGPVERKLSFGVFMGLFVCFIYTAFSIFSFGDSCLGYEEGMARLRAEREFLQEALGSARSEIVLLKGLQGNLTSLPTPR